MTIQEYCLLKCKHFYCRLLISFKTNLSRNIKFVKFVKFQFGNPAFDFLSEAKHKKNRKTFELKRANRRRVKAVKSEKSVSARFFKNLKNIIYQVLSIQEKLNKSYYRFLDSKSTKKKIRILFRVLNFRQTCK
jgi:hypothetical protein